jgi:hypothetical protein
MQAVMNLVWDRLLPAMQPAALPAAEADRKKLVSRLGTLKVRPAEGTASPKLAASISGKTYVFDDNPAKFQSFSADWRSQRSKVVLKSKRNGADENVVCDKDTWIKGHLTVRKEPNQAVATTCAWTSPDTLTLKIVEYETPFYYTTKIRFTPQKVAFESSMNVDTEELSHLEGHAQR